MKLLRNMGLPPGFEDLEIYRVDIDDEPMLFHGAYVFSTEMGFELAVSRLELLLGQHYGLPQKAISGARETIMSCVLTCILEAQEITARITDLGGHCGGYIRSANKWRRERN